MRAIEARTDVNPADATQMWLATGSLVPHPDNPRRNLGDLTELARSVKAHGVLMPILVLPASDDGTHMIVAGHRRHAAAVIADLPAVPVIVREMTPVEVIEAMLIENEHRGELSVSEQIAAIERLMSFEDGLSPAKLCRRIGKSTAWVRTRMALAVLPGRWRERVDGGDLTLAAAEAAATAADLGPEHMEQVLERLVDGGSWQDPARVVVTYRRDLERDASYREAADRARKGAGIVFTTDDPPPEGAKALRDIFDARDLIAAHKKQECHATLVRRVSWGDGFEVVALCTKPKSHRQSGNSDLPSDRHDGRPAETSHAKRKGRVARVEHLAEAFARSKGGPSKADLTELALRALIHEAGAEPVRYACAILSIEPGDDPQSALADAASQSPAGLARVAGAIACGIAEAHMYWSVGSARCAEYLSLLIETGWTPDEWTANQLPSPVG